MKTVSLLLISSFVSSQALAQVTIDVPERATMTASDGSGDSKSIDAHQAAPVDLTKPALLTMAGRVPVLVIPVGTGPQKLTLVPPKVEVAAPQVIQENVDKKLESVVMGMQQVETLLRNKQIAQAQSAVEKLCSDYPRIPFLNFLRASVLVAGGKRQEAAQVTREALKTHPDYKPGQDLMKALEGSVK